jgi:lipopolysaccharide/colanic/teichoic acid biosynthesis glycosyltransferase
VYGKAVKRLFDIISSAFGLLLLSPLFLIVTILIKLDSTGPVFYRQMRVGMNFRPFWIIKFRTMENKADKKGLQITAGGDKRVTRLGRVLRKVKIDELPQLFNVLRGEMSLVGPRPEVEKYVELYKKDYEEILKIRPGITDISSVIFSNEEGVLQNQADPEWYYKHILLPEKIKLAREYMSRASFFYDIKIIFRTFYKVFCQVIAKLFPATMSPGQ